LNGAPVPPVGGSNRPRSGPAGAVLDELKRRRLSASARLVRMPDTICCNAELTVNLPREATLALFTAEGERAWAPGWDPAFPAPQRTEGSGAVFVTAQAEETTTWVMVDQDERGVRYARFTPAPRPAPSP